MHTTRRTCSTFSPTMSSARSRLAIEPGWCMPVSKRTMPSPGRHRPGVAVRHAGPRQRQAQAPDAGQQLLAAADLALACGSGHRQRHLMHRVPASPDEENDDGHRRRSDTETTRVAREYFEALGRAERDAQQRYYAADARASTSTASPGRSGRDEMIGLLRRALRRLPRLALRRSSTTVAEGDGAAVRWRARATFAGPGNFMGFEPNGARVDIEGVDLVRVRDGRIAPSTPT